MRWLPLFDLSGWTGCWSTATYEGRALAVRFGPFIIEISVGRADPTLGE